MGRPRTRYAVECQNCGRQFDTIPSRPGRYCTPACYQEAKTGKPRGPYAERETKSCIVCGKSFVVGGFGNPRRTQAACSDACSRKSRKRRSAPVSRLAPLDAAYIAGLVDGEGSIMLYARAGASVHIKLTISNTVRSALVWVSGVTGVGAVLGVKRPPHRNGYWWVVSSHAAADVLRQLRPYMRIKCAQADLALATDERLDSPESRANREWQAEARAEMQRLNRVVAP